MTSPYGSPVPEDRLTLLREVVGLLLIVAGLIVLVWQAFEIDVHLGGCVVGAYIIAGGIILGRTG